MDSKIRIGTHQHFRSHLVDRDNPSGQRILALARDSKAEVFCLCTGTPQRMFVRKIDTGFTLTKQKGTGPLHHPDCPSVREYDGYGLPPNANNKVVRTIDGVRSRLQLETSDNEDLQYLLHHLWLDAGFGQWAPHYHADYYLTKHKLNLTLAAAKIRWTEQNLADLIVIPDISSAQSRESDLAGRIKSMVQKYQRNPILIARIESVTESRYSRKISLRDIKESLWMRDEEFNAFSTVSGFQLVESVKPGANVFGIFEVWVSEKGNIQCATAGLMACTSNGIPYLCEVHRKLIVANMIERKSFSTRMVGFKDMEVSLKK